MKRLVDGLPVQGIIIRGAALPQRSAAAGRVNESRVNDKINQIPRISAVLCGWSQLQSGDGSLPMNGTYIVDSPLVTPDNASQYYFPNSPY